MYWASIFERTEGERGGVLSLCSTPFPSCRGLRGLRPFWHGGRGTFQKWSLALHPVNGYFVISWSRYLVDQRRTRSARCLLRHVHVWHSKSQPKRANQLLLLYFIFLYVERTQCGRSTNPFYSRLSKHQILLICPRH